MADRCATDFWSFYERTWGHSVSYKEFSCRNKTAARMSEAFSGPNFFLFLCITCKQLREWRTHCSWMLRSYEMFCTGKNSNLELEPAYHHWNMLWKGDASGCPGHMCLYSLFESSTNGNLWIPCHCSRDRFSVHWRHSPNGKTNPC